MVAHHDKKLAERLGRSVSLFKLNGGNLRAAPHYHAAMASSGYMAGLV